MISRKKHLWEIVKCLSSTYPNINTFDIIEKIDGDLYNFEGKEYRGIYKEESNILVAKSLEADLTLFFKIKEFVKVVIPDNNKPILVDVLLIGK